MTTAIDTNIFSALWSGEALAFEVLEALGDLQKIGPLIICGVVYCELQAHPLVRPAFVDKFLLETGVEVDTALSREIWLEAGLRFARHSKRKRGSAVQGRALNKRLADFIVGSHALLNANVLLTLDKRRYKTDFKELKLIEIGAS